MLGTELVDLLRRFDPNQPRDPHTGKWIDTTPGDGGAALLAALTGDTKDGVRVALRDPNTTEGVALAYAAEYKRITGRTARVNFTGSDVQVAREHAEGLLRCSERFPEVRIDQVLHYGDGSARPELEPELKGAYAWAGIAPTEPNGVYYVYTIAFNGVFAGDADRYRESLDYAESVRWAVPGGPMSTAIHEFGHRLAEHTQGRTAAHAIATQHAKAAGKKPSVHIRDTISEYAKTTPHELAAEAFADVMLRGDAASETSRAIFQELEDRYRRQHP